MPIIWKRNVSSHLQRIPIVTSIFFSIWTSWALVVAFSLTASGQILSLVVSCLYSLPFSVYLSVEICFGQLVAKSSLQRHPCRRTVGSCIVSSTNNYYIRWTNKIDGDKREKEIKGNELIQIINYLHSPCDHNTRKVQSAGIVFLGVEEEEDAREESLPRAK